MPQTEGGHHIDSFDMLTALGINALTQVKRKQYEPDMLEGPTQRERTRHRPPGGLCMIQVLNKAEWIDGASLYVLCGTYVEARWMVERRRNYVMASREAEQQRAGIDGKP
ncbi:hypothetical protein BJY52DRAFT_1225160 [Lactarius psammicola]|nr:hypothetical protein BJY52DRAFT_1225160 [Lactarius psammicola]